MGRVFYRISGYPNIENSCTSDNKALEFIQYTNVTLWYPPPIRYVDNEIINLITSRTHFDSAHEHYSKNRLALTLAYPPMGCSTTFTSAALSLRNYLYVQLL